MKAKGQHIVVTGAANGIGEALVRHLLDRDNHITACDIDKDKLDQLYKGEARVEARKLDVRQPEQWQSILADLKQPPNILIQAAGVIRSGYLADTDQDDIDLQIDVNLKGVIWGTKYTAEIMADHGGGMIVNIASMAGIAPVSGIGPYTASKFGVRGFSLAMAQELQVHGINVSVVAPDAVDTGMLDEQMDKEATALTFSGNKILTVDDVASVVIKDAIESEKTEIWIPFNRGVQAYLGATFPGMAALLTKTLRKRGLKQQADFRKRRKR